VNPPNYFSVWVRQFPWNKLLPWLFETVLLTAVLTLTPGCSLLRAPQKVVTAVVPGTRSSQPDPLGLQLELQRYADDFFSRTDRALDESAGRVGTESAQVEVLRLKVKACSSILSIVSGPNPNANLLDMVSVTVLTRRSVQDYWLNTTNGAAFQPWVEASRELETSVWRLAARYLRTNQVDELRQGINQWYEQNPDVRTAFFARPQEIASMVRTSEEKDGRFNSVFSLVNLDPTAGLDPAVREVTRTRLFAERAMFTMQRMPFLLRMQTELLSYELAGQSAVQLALTNTTTLAESADRLSRAAEGISQTAAQLPDRISIERKEVLAAFDQQEGKLKELAAQVDSTLQSGESMSTSLNTTITTFDGLMKRFGVGEPSTNTTPDDSSPPFNILDYAQTASQVGAMAKDLNTLVSSVNQSVPQMQQLGAQAGADLQKVVDHGFRLGLVLIAVLLAGAVVAGLVYRFFAQKMTRSSGLSSPQKP
jgi:hypothetical protein